MNVERIKNIESPFTELFGLLKRYDCMTEGSSFEHGAEELKVVYQHTDNAIGTLLQGLQDLGKLISHGSNNKTVVTEELNNIWFFITTIVNLTEALNTLRADTCYVLREKKVIDY